MTDNAMGFNAIVDKIIECFDSMIVDSSIKELEKKANIVLLRSAKEDVLCRFLKYLENENYTGIIHIIGRKGDEKYIQIFENLKILVYAVDDRQKYTVDNTNEYIQKVQADAVCFLYQNKISASHENLLQIVNQLNCGRYAISNQLKINKLIGLNKYLIGKRIYDELCDWFYQEDKMLLED